MIVLKYPNLIRMFISHSTTGKRKKITMDFKNVLQEWKEYQKYKLKMANSFPCTVTFSYTETSFKGNLSFVGAGVERCIQIFDPNISHSYRFLLSKILGSTPENVTIRYTLSEDRFVRAYFPNEAIRIAAHEAYLAFEREEFGLTLPSSSDSD